ncbi:MULTISPECIES: hypothetical protein [unclassified Cryobacterium]|uniref:hypothetical protein n=1 Tax=unclassified Cryobacterium TaxID=2649013 RepID=UPI002AB3D573|nr:MULTISPECIES: hypothetical protein [unclassified Cryobacterium]MDY7528797.1 hypothetical protein [Cryobacterium sp. 10C2]MDY7555462.1 hypothetical protein [Cryobacterium sp. 10C3]MEB0200992.1 hypothetical protein [Cryobacterium sp. 5I3]MEB0285232.1 hypothetical protein [Cryobacterium sp. 10S3]MEB0290863.1 hypothetical protein [Cryobacterium sp. 10C2]
MQGAGTGEALVRAAIDEARAWGVSAVVPVFTACRTVRSRQQRDEQLDVRVGWLVLGTVVVRVPERGARRSRTVTTCHGDDPGRAASAVFVRWSDD